MVFVQGAFHKNLYSHKIESLEIDLTKKIQELQWTDRS